MWQIEPSPLGRIAVPPHVPQGTAVFCTTVDFPGRLSPDASALIGAAIEERAGKATVLTTCNQIHSANVTRASREKSWRECDSCDALWSPENDVSIGIKVADCLPVAMVDPLHSVIANVHSGWRGAVQGITAATVDAMARETSFDATSAFAYLGPSIRVCCFEVGEEVAERFEPRYVDRTRETPHVDLAAYIKDILLDRGFAADRISDSALCTRCEGSIFHSYRRDGGGYGRNLMLVAQ